MLGFYWPRMGSNNIVASGRRSEGDQPWAGRRWQDGGGGASFGCRVCNVELAPNGSSEPPPNTGSSVALTISHHAWLESN